MHTRTHLWSIPLQACFYIYNFFINYSMCSCSLINRLLHMKLDRKILVKHFYYTINSIQYCTTKVLQVTHFLNFTAYLVCTLFTSFSAKTIQCIRWWLKGNANVIWKHGLEKRPSNYIYFFTIQLMLMRWIQLKTKQCFII